MTINDLKEFKVSGISSIEMAQHQKAASLWEHPLLIFTCMLKYQKLQTNVFLTR